eukprot:m.139549 g.139549  ORF g.139549 m.139549 type:complete len:63 (-) comp17630_c0_seq1:275-463(-)
MGHDSRLSTRTSTVVLLYSFFSFEDNRNNEMEEVECIMFRCKTLSSAACMCTQSLVEEGYTA